MKLTIFSPSGVVIEGRRLQLASKRLRALGLSVQVDESARARFQRFAGADDVRLQAIERVARDGSDIALAARGGYGLSRLLDRIDWDLIAQSVCQGKRWVGHSDFTAFSLALLAHTGARSWAGPMAQADFGQLQDQAQGHHGGEAQSDKGQGDRDAVDLCVLDEITSECFLEAMRGELEAVGFRTEQGFDGVQAQGVLWGGNLTMLCSLLATLHFPQIDGGILFLEDVNEQPYRVERMLLQLHQAGVLERQSAIVLGDFGKWQPNAVDRGYRLIHAIRYIRSMCSKPILTGLPFGHIQTKLTLPVGVESSLEVNGKEAFIYWGHQGHADDLVSDGAQAALEGDVAVDPRALEDEETPWCCCGAGCRHRFPI